MLRGYYQDGEQPDNLTVLNKTLGPEKTPEFWKDWRWQLRHAVRDPVTIVLGTRFHQEEREDL